MKESVLLTIVLVMCIGAKLTETSLVSQCNLGSPETNILTMDMRDQFVLIGYPNVATFGSHPRNVADEKSWIMTSKWPQHGYRTNQDSSGLAYLKIDLKHKYYVRAFAVSGYAGGGHRPTGNWFLEGSHNGHSWKMVGIGKPNQWYAPGTYPFEASQIVKSLYPAKFRHYRIIARGWTNKAMLINNIGLFL